MNDFLMKHFTEIMDYNFTAKVEQDFDKIAEGDEQWTQMMKSFYLRSYHQYHPAARICAEG